MGAVDHATDHEATADHDVGTRPQAAGDQGGAATPTVAAPAPPARAGGSVGQRQVQARSTVGPADDPAEHEADRTADRVMRMAAPEQDRPTKVPASAPGSGGAGSTGGAGGPGKAAAVPAPAPVPPASKPTPAAAPGAASPTPAVGPAAGPTPAAAAPPGAAPAAAGPKSATGPPAAAPAAAGPKPGATPEPPKAEPARRAGPKADGPGAASPAEDVAEKGPAAGAAPPVPEATQKYLDRTAGGGAPLPEEARRYFETRFKADFTPVRIHDDDQADAAAKSLKAVAFTRGNDIYFSAGAYDPVTDPGRRLLAHELTHVVQQAPGINRKAAPAAGGTVRRAPGDKANTKSADKPQGTLTRVKVPDDIDDKKATDGAPAGQIDTGANPTLALANVYLPAFKAKEHGPKLTLNRAARSDGYRETWKSDAAARLTPHVKARANALGLAQEPFFLKWKSLRLFGSASDIADAITQMPWEHGPAPAKARAYDIDHRKEHQLGGDDGIDNLWLLDRGLNRGVGKAIETSIDRDIKAFLAVAGPKLVKPPSAGQVKSKYAVTFDQVLGQPNPRAGSAAPLWGHTLTTADAWERKDLSLPQAVEPLVAMDVQDRDRLKGSTTKLSLITQKGGGSVRSVPWDAASNQITVKSFFAARSFRATAGLYTATTPPTASGQKVGRLMFSFLEGNANMTAADRAFDIVSVPGIEYGGLVDTSAVRELGKAFGLKHASPIDFPDLDLDLEKGLVGRGVVHKPTVKLLENVEIAVVLDGADVRVEAEIDGGELKLPGPFKVSGGSLVLSAGSEGLAAKGKVDFEIEKLAKGSIEGVESSRGGLALRGNLDFDTKMFTEFKLGLTYTDGKWGVTGKLGVGPDKIKGIKRASASVTVDDDKVDASGEFESSIKGVEKGKVGFKYDPATGMAITGEIELGKGVPGLKGGKLAATVKEGKDGWSLSGAVTIQPNVPGVDGDVTGTYDDGAFLVEANVSYAKGMAKGSVRVGLTNQEVGPDNKPAGPPKDTLLVYGGGEVTLTITPWLQGTVGLQLKRDGSIEVKGKVALPDHFDVFPEKKVEKRIFSIGIDIPIVGVSVAGQRIGIFATIKGGMDIEAGFGPGQLRDLGLEVVYNPDHEDDTRVTGTATFAIPAHAGLKLFVDGGLGVGIPVVSATAGVEIFGELGLAGEASASAKVEWSPGRGVVLDAKGELMVEPKFKFGIDAFVDVSADLLIHTIELYHHVWHLAAFEYGSGLRFGMTFPIHYEEGKPFDLSFDQVQWTYPHIDPGELLGGLMKQLVD